ncbi:TetR/AcrR family transcriptional regulator [Fodinicola acaciae]|uniref:TetR/AcrR family transcriptional regulator n=1 Tax=Fodinicola acaciae TaxID=2681555 RepID=UPI0013D5BD89|nr:TetR/AcrR family transcriptional regulator [Fodinicola acaciae]
MTARNAGGRPRDPENDVAILRAALELLIERGPDGTSIEQVAKRAGVARLTVYRRFANKDELLIKAVEAARLTTEPRLGDIGALSIEEMLDFWSNALSQIHARQLLARLVGSLPDNPTLFRTYWDAYVEPRRAVFAKIIERERDAGQLPPDTDPQVFQDLVGGAVFYRLVITPDPLPADGMRDYLRSLLSHLGYRPEKRSD